MIDVSSGARRMHTRALGAAAIAIVLGWSTLAVYSIHASLPSNPVRLPFASNVQAQALAPQGWSFFTRDPHFPRMTAYTRSSNGRWVPAGVGPYARPENALGLIRSPGAQEHELKWLTDRLAAPRLSACEGDLDTCLNHAEVAARVTNHAPRPTLCGSVGIVVQKPVPWSWRNDGVRMEPRFARLEVQCD
jgi:antimicrobial peptide system SdpA family protein